MLHRGGPPRKAGDELFRIGRHAAVLRTLPCARDACMDGAGTIASHFAEGAPAAKAALDVVASTDITALEATWRSAEDRLVATPYQRFEVVRAWFETLGRHARPAIVVARAATGETCLLLPLAVTRFGPIRVARIAGGGHTNFCAPLFDPRAPWTGAAMRSILGRAAREAGVDAYALLHVPLVWNEAPNPLALLPSQPSANPAWRAKLAGDPQAAVQALRGGTALRRLRGKERKLAESGPVAFVTAATEDEREEILAAFFVQKAAWAERQGLPNVFDRPGTREFFARIAASGAFRLYALKAGPQIVAIFGGAAHQGRFSTSINAFDEAFGRASPGESLLRRLIESCAREGLHGFDLGVGHAEYKRRWLPDDEPVVDVFLGVGAAGRAGAATLAAAYAAKRLVKTSPVLSRWVHAARARLAR
jgi:CelD/BcsL family acetyltransferase involved in cellulose biosynthesis